MSPRACCATREVVSSLDDLRAAASSSASLRDDLQIAGRARKTRPPLHRQNLLRTTTNARAELKRDDVAIIRLEQLYPLPQRSPRIRRLTDYPAGTPAFWVQEEPENMGPWRYMRVNFGEKLFEKFPFSGLYREASASPATGSGVAPQKGTRNPAPAGVRPERVGSGGHFAREARANLIPAGATVSA